MIIAELHLMTGEVGNYDRFSVTATGLEFLGLKSLRKIVGQFFFYGNKNLCYMNISLADILTGRSLLDQGSDCAGIY